MRDVRYFPGGWSMTAERDYDSLVMDNSAFCAMGVIRYRIDGLRVTADEATALLLNSRSGHGRADCSGTILLNGIELEYREAEAIRRGAHPLAVLLPPLMIRTLTATEMTSD